MFELSLIQRLVIWVLPVVFAITVHEVAHGWVARRLGDPTAMMLGRLTLNPIKHIDPIGTLLVPAVLLMFSPFVFGWAKPVPVTWENLRHPKRDMALVALAGPTANLLMALLWAVVIQVGMFIQGAAVNASLFLIYVGVAGIFINVVLMVLNLLPLPPLDGGRVLVGLLPRPWDWRVGRVEPYGFFILLLLLFSGVLWNLLWPVVATLLLSLGTLGGVSGSAMFTLLNALMSSAGG